MGWGDCGKDDRGRNIGYVWEATCDHPGCSRKIDRGLSYACEGMHGFVEWGCDQYFCSAHMHLVEDPDGQAISLCHQCCDKIEFDDDDKIIDTKENIKYGG